MGIDGTMMGSIRNWASTAPTDAALHVMDGDGGWAVTSWEDYWERVRRVARGLIALGVAPGDSVSLVARNGPDWVVVQHGITAAGAVPCPIYTTNLPMQVAHIVDHSESSVLFLDDQEQLGKVRAAQSQGAATVERIVTFADLGDAGDDVLTLAGLETLGDDVPDAELDARLDAVAPSDVALRVYTSGTTGLPKGAELTHAGIAAVIDALDAAAPDVFGRRTNRGLSYMPLCHAAEQIFTNYLGTRFGWEYYFCPDLDALVPHLRAVRPTVLLGVPRVWEKFESALRAGLAEQTGGAALPEGWRATEEQSAGLLGALGLDEVELAFSGAAPIAESTLGFFDAIGLTIHECYGMTETSGVATLQPIGAPRVGTVGKPIAGVEVRLGDGGELLLRGPNMVAGYHKLPEQTAELYDGEWMRTGDLATIDDDGFVSITGRLKDLLITAGGKNVGPAEMEGHLVSIPGIEQAVAVGDRMPYLTALLVLDPETVPLLLKEAGVEQDLSTEDAATDERVLAYLRRQVDERCNANVARYQQIKYFEVLPEPFSVDGGEMTPTMKMKRNVITRKYADVIAGMYERAASGRR